MVATFFENTKEVMDLLAQGVDVNAVDENGWTALATAGKNSKIDSKFFNQFSYSSLSGSWQCQARLVVINSQKRSEYC